MNEKSTKFSKVKTSFYNNIYGVILACLSITIGVLSGIIGGVKTISSIFDGDEIEFVNDGIYINSLENKLVSFKYSFIKENKDVDGESGYIATRNLNIENLPAFNKNQVEIYIKHSSTLDPNSLELWKNLVKNKNSGIIRGDGPKINFELIKLRENLYQMVTSIKLESGSYSIFNNRINEGYLFLLVN